MQGDILPAQHDGGGTAESQDVLQPKGYGQVDAALLGAVCRDRTAVLSSVAGIHDEGACLCAGSGGDSLSLSVRRHEGGHTQQYRQDAQDRNDMFHIGIHLPSILWPGGRFHVIIPQIGPKGKGSCSH